MAGEPGGSATSGGSAHVGNLERLSPLDVSNLLVDWRFLAGACPIVGSYGAKDRSNRGIAQKLDRALEALGVDHDVGEYPALGTRSSTTTTARATAPRSYSW